MKKNYWLKLKEDFFTQPYIKKLRRIAGGDTYTIIYQKILLMSINSGGLIEHQGIEATLEEELALILDEDVENVKITLQFMKSCNLIEKESEKESFLLPEVLTIIGSESQSAQWVRDYRARKKEEKSLQCKENVMPERERDIDIDIDIERDIDTEVVDLCSNINISSSINTLASNDFSKSKKYSKLPVQKINFNFETNEFENITREDTAIWQEAFPSANIDLELKRMRAWLTANPAKRKSNYKSFIAKWLTRVETSGKLITVNNSRPQPKTFDQIRNENIINTGKSLLEKIMENYKGVEND